MLPEEAPPTVKQKAERPKMFLHQALNMFISAVKLGVLTHCWIQPQVATRGTADIIYLFFYFFIFWHFSTEPVIADIVGSLWHFICGTLKPQLETLQPPWSSCVFWSESGCILSGGCVHTIISISESPAAAERHRVCVTLILLSRVSLFIWKRFHSAFVAPQKKHFALLRRLQYAKYQFT